MFPLLQLLVRLRALGHDVLQPWTYDVRCGCLHGCDAGRYTTQKQWVYEDILTNGFPTYILTTGSEMGPPKLSSETELLRLGS